LLTATGSRCRLPFNPFGLVLNDQERWVQPLIDVGEKRSRASRPRPPRPGSVEALAFATIPELVCAFSIAC
jgi:hypothetical protein